MDCGEKNGIILSRVPREDSPEKVTLEKMPEAFQQQVTSLCGEGAFQAQSHRIHRPRQEHAHQALQATKLVEWR